MKPLRFMRRKGILEIECFMTALGRYLNNTECKPVIRANSPGTGIIGYEQFYHYIGIRWTE